MLVFSSRLFLMLIGLLFLQQMWSHTIHIISKFSFFSLTIHYGYFSMDVHNINVIIFNGCTVCHSMNKAWYVKSLLCSHLGCVQFFAITNNIKGMYLYENLCVLRNFCISILKKELPCQWAFKTLVDTFELHFQVVVTIAIPSTTLWQFIKHTWALTVITFGSLPILSV